MYQGRYQSNGKARTPKHRRKLNKYFLVTLSLVLLLGIAGGATLAYLIDKDEGEITGFAPAEVQCDLTQSQDGVYTVTNNGDVSVYVRAAVIVNWENADGEINAFAPVETVNGSNGDYTVKLEDEDWSREDDGLYYYGKRLAKGESVSFAQIIEYDGENTGAFSLRAEVLLEVIQAEGMDAESAEEAWEIASNPQSNG